MDSLNQQQVPPQPQPPTPIINPPPEQSPTPNNSWLKWVVLTILVAFLSSAGTYLILNSKVEPTPSVTKTFPSPTPDQTTNWKTYTNTAGQYSIKYSPNYSTYENKTPSVDGVWVNSENTFGMDSGIFHLIISFRTVGTNKTLSQLIDEFSACIYIVGNNGKPYIIDSKEGYFYEDTGCGPIGSTDWYVYNKDKLYSITFLSTDSYRNSQDQVTQILSTFKFLN